MNSVLDKTTPELISLLEETIKTYTPASGKALSEARKLIQLNFKTYLDEKILPTTALKHSLDEPLGTIRA